MRKLNDTHSLLLSSASQRETGSLFPLPEGHVADHAATGKAINALRRGKLVEQRDAPDAASTWQRNDDVCTGLFITPAGLKAIGIDDAETEVDMPTSEAPSDTPRPLTKTASVITLLERPDGATLPEIIAITDWLPHTTRAALTGLRKKGHAIERTRRDDATCYRIAGIAA